MDLTVITTEWRCISQLDHQTWKMPDDPKKSRLSSQNSQSPNLPTMTHLSLSNDIVDVCENLESMSLCLYIDPTLATS